VVNAGHGNESINEAIKKQIDNVIHISNLMVIEPQVKLAKKLADLFHDNYSSFFCNSGTEANEGAIKLARKYGDNDRYKIITLKHSFHGRTITSLKATGQKDLHNYFGPFPDGFVYADDIDDIKNKFDDKTIAVMIELIQGEGGLEALEIDKVQNLSVWCKQNNLLLIVDEVQSGVFRTGEFLASMKYDIKPDIITIAKALGNGVPIGAIMTNKKDIFTYGDHGSTFGGNFLSSRSGLATLEFLFDLKQNGYLDKIINLYQDELSKLALNFPNLIIKKTGLGMMGGLRMKQDVNTDNIILKSFENKLIILKAGKNTIRLFPPLSIEEDVLRDGFDRFTRVLDGI